MRNGVKDGRDLLRNRCVVYLVVELGLSWLTPEAGDRFLKAFCDLFWALSPYLPEFIDRKNLGGDDKLAPIRLRPLFGFQRVGVKVVGITESDGGEEDTALGASTLHFGTPAASGHRDDGASVEAAEDETPTSVRVHKKRPPLTQAILLTAVESISTLLALPFMTTSRFVSLKSVS